MVVITSRQVKNLRSRFGAAGAKDDRFDSFVLADTLRTDRARLRPLIPDALATISLRMAVRARRDLVAHRVAAGNQLRAHLAVAFPAGLRLFHDLDSPISLASRWPRARSGLRGQRCTANRRVIVERTCLAGFIKHLERALGSLHCGDARDSETHVCPSISATKREQVAGLVSRAESSSPVVLHGQSFDGPAFYPPTVIRRDDPRHELVQEETFGPLMVLQPASDFDHAMKLCNGVQYGLVAALFSKSLERRTQFLNDAQAGILKINSATSDADAEAPFGGWKASGDGPPEHGRSNREIYTRTQAVYTMMTK